MKPAPLAARAFEPFANEFNSVSSADNSPSVAFDAASIFAAVGEAAYDWRIDSDVLSWSGNAPAVLLVPDPAAVGRASQQRRS